MRYVISLEELAYFIHKRDYAMLALPSFFLTFKCTSQKVAEGFIIPAPIHL